MPEETPQPTMLAKALEVRDAAVAAYDAFAAPIEAEKRGLTTEEDAERISLYGDVAAAEDRVIEIHQLQKRERKIDAARKFALGDATSKSSDTKVKSEPRTYYNGGPHSYFADFVRASGVGPFANAIDADEAKARLARHANEVASDVREGGPEAERALRMVRGAKRTSDGAATRSAEKELRARADRMEDSEYRVGMDTTSASGGSFVTPVYFVQDWASFNQFSRVFADQTNLQGLPDYGMTVYIPQVTAASSIGSQASQNTGINETDPVSGYLSNSLTTEAGQVTVSQQLLDRAGPNFAFDKLIFDSLNRAHDVAVDGYVLTQALASAGSITATTSAAASTNTPASTTLTGLGYVQQKVAQAKAATVDASGVVLPATHAFFLPVRWENLSSSVDVNGRPLLNPDYAGVFAALAAGGPQTPIAEGSTGFKLQGLPVFEDGNIPQATGQPTQDQVIVAHMPEVWTFEGDKVPRVVPQTLAQNLSVLLQLYSYLTVIVRYPKAVQSITGAAFSTPVWIA